MDDTTSPDVQDNDASFRESSLPTGVESDLQRPCRLSQLLNNIMPVNTQLQWQLQEVAQKEAQLRKDLEQIHEFERRLRSRLEYIQRQPRATLPPRSATDMEPSAAHFCQPTSSTPPLTMDSTDQPPPAPEAAGLHGVQEVWNKSSNSLSKNSTIERPAPFLKKPPQGGGVLCACPRHRLSRPHSTRHHRGVKKKAFSRQSNLSRSQSTHDQTEPFSLAHNVGPSPAPSLPPSPQEQQLLDVEPTDQELLVVFRLLGLGPWGDMLGHWAGKDEGRGDEGGPMNE